MAVSKRGNTWFVTIYNPITKRKEYQRGTYATQKEARRAEATVLLARRRSDITVAGYASTWLDTHPRFRTSTNIHHAERIRGYVTLYGTRLIASINRVEAREWALENRSQVASVRAMFSDAKRDDVIQTNPFTELRLQQSRGRRDLDVLSVEEVTRLGQIARETYGPGFAAFVLTAAYCGLRPGELYALRWPRIDFANDEIEVAGSYSTRSKETTAPKNNQQRRVVLFPEAREALLLVPRSNGPVFTTLTGRQLTGESLHYYWSPVRTAIGKPTMSFYEMRHFCAAHLLNTLGHEAEDVALQLGHDDGGALVRRLYGHPDERLARERLKRNLGRKLTLIDLRKEEDTG